MQECDEDALKALSKLRRFLADHPTLVAEALDIRASVILETTFVREHYAGLSGVKLHAAQVSGWRSSGRDRKLTLPLTVSVPGDQQIQIPTSGSWVLCHVLPTVHGLQRFVVPVEECHVELS
jgi:hypothetical protein